MVSVSLRSSVSYSPPTAAAKKSEGRSSDGFFFDLQANTLAVLCPDYLLLQIFVAEVLQAPKKEREGRLGGGGEERTKNGR